MTTNASETKPWYTITVVEHAEHPQRPSNPDASAPPVEVIACTVLPTLAGAILREVADQIAPVKKQPVMRGGEAGQ